mmetsp:Transcript_80212/g.180982  ORF Transcript_80212/g.180982 Transcript_80212/m.180982 type:complete len:217 (+) Transcript_80212:539-1189(+)
MTKEVQTSGMGAETARKQMKASKRSTRCVNESLRGREPPSLAAAAKSWSASEHMPQVRPSFVNARNTQLNSCGFNTTSSCKHVGSNVQTASMSCGTAELPIAFCRSKAHRRLAMPCEWICCRSARDEPIREAMAVKSSSCTTPRRENAHAVMDSSWSLKSGRSAQARQPTSYRTWPLGCSFAVARPQVRLASSTGFTSDVRSLEANSVATWSSMLE